jgi:hypothetical protein
MSARWYISLPSCCRTGTGNSVLQRFKVFSWQLTEVLNIITVFTLFISTTAQQFHAKIHTITQQASYMFWPFSTTIREVFNKEKEKHNIYFL